MKPALASIHPPWSKAYQTYSHNSPYSSPLKQIQWLLDISESIDSFSSTKHTHTLTCVHTCTHPHSCDSSKTTWQSTNPLQSLWGMWQSQLNLAFLTHLLSLPRLTVAFHSPHHAFLGDVLFQVKAHWKAMWCRNYFWLLFNIFPTNQQLLC